MAFKKLLHIDIETYSDVDLTECGVYKYCESPNFEVLLFAYAYDDEPSKVIDLANFEEIPSEVLKDLNNAEVLKIAHNANFERTCLHKYLNMNLDVTQWRCSAVRSASLGLPRGLDALCKALNINEDEAKLKTGKALIKYFCVPCAPTKKNGGRLRNLPEHDADKWALFKVYNARDVDAERAVCKAMAKYPSTTKAEHRLWWADQIINDHGVLVDEDFINGIIDNLDTYYGQLEKRLFELTGLDNPNSLTQLRGWFLKNGKSVLSLAAEAVTNLISEYENKTSVRTPFEDKALEVLKIRQILGKTSVAKYEAMKRSLCDDRRIRGMLLFYGAARTGRWAGRLVQLHNLPQNHMADLDLARQLVKDKDFETLELLYANPLDVYSQLIRTAFIAKEGNTFIVADYSAIEARVIAWLSDEKWVMDVFASHGKIYEATASQMFGVPLETVTKGSDLRKKGKVAQLACGYGGGVGALTAMDRNGDIPDNEKQSLIDAWRAANPNIVKFWRTLEKSAIEAVCNPGVTVNLQKGIKMFVLDSTLFITLPSGRNLAYPNARLGSGSRGIEYDGPDQKTGRWSTLDTYGGKLAENITQAVARDVLGQAIINLGAEGFKIRFHVHDEVIVEVPSANAEELALRVKEIMALKDGSKTSWWDGLILNAEFYITDFYKKD